MVKNKVIDLRELKKDIEELGVDINVKILATGENYINAKYPTSAKDADDYARILESGYHGEKYKFLDIGIEKSENLIKNRIKKEIRNESSIEDISYKVMEDIVDAVALEILTKPNYDRKRTNDTLKDTLTLLNGIEGEVSVAVINK